MAKVFISYRRSDAGFATDRLYEELKRHVADPTENIFLDIDAIPPGLDFVDHIAGKVAQCDVLLAVIGPHWLTAKDEQGRRRIEQDDDFVRIEIASALARDVRVVPVLLDAEPMPTAAALPPDIQALARRQGVRVSRERFAEDVGKLAAELGLSGDAPKTPAAPAPPPASPSVKGRVKSTWSERAPFSYLSLNIAALLLAGPIAAMALGHRRAGDLSVFFGVIAFGVLAAAEWWWDRFSRPDRYLDMLLLAIVIMNVSAAVFFFAGWVFRGARRSGGRGGGAAGRRE